MNAKSALKGRGAQLNVPNKFLALSHEQRDDFLEHCYKEGENPEKITEEYEDEGNVNRVTKLLRHPGSI